MACAQHASAKAVGLAAKAKPGVINAAAATIFVSIFMSFLQNLNLVITNAPDGVGGGVSDLSTCNVSDPNGSWPLFAKSSGSLNSRTVGMTAAPQLRSQALVVERQLLVCRSQQSAQCARSGHGRFVHRRSLQHLSDHRMLSGHSKAWYYPGTGETSSRRWGRYTYRSAGSNQSTVKHFMAFDARKGG